MQPLPSFDLILFGGTGDLALRKLLPALYRRELAGQLSADSRIIGVARSEMSREEYLAQVETSCRDQTAKLMTRAWLSIAEGEPPARR